MAGGTNIQGVDARSSFSGYKFTVTPHNDCEIIPNLEVAVNKYTGIS
jgi:hypothetical protein